MRTIFTMCLEKKNSVHTTLSRFTTFTVFCFSFPFVFCFIQWKCMAFATIWKQKIDIQYHKCVYHTTHSEWTYTKNVQDYCVLKFTLSWENIEHCEQKQCVRGKSDRKEIVIVSVISYCTHTHTHKRTGSMKCYKI